MIVRSFLKWFENAPAAERVEAARAMAQAYVADHLGSDSREDAEAALTLILDDPAMQVRRALAWELADYERAPRHIIVALAHDQPEVAAPVLARSPLLREPDLIDCADGGAVLTQTAIAMRTSVPAAVSAVLAKLAEPTALSSLLRNPGAEIGPESFAAMAQRHGSDPALREAMNQRDDLPVTVRQALLCSLSQDLMAFASGWMTPQRAERAITETRDIATVGLAAHADDLGALVDYLSRTGQLTPGLLLRSLLCGETALFGAALSHLSGLNARRVAGMFAARGQGALSAVCLRAGLPSTHLPAFLAAAAAIRDLQPPYGETPRLNRAIVQRTLAACLEQDESAMSGLLALLRRYDAEAAREDARAVTAQIMLTGEPAMVEAASTPFVPDIAALESAIEIDYDQPFSNADLRDVRPILIDLDRFAADLAPLENVMTAAGDTGQASDRQDGYASDMDTLFESAFDQPTRPEAPTLEPLRVIERQDQQLDENYFNSWELRKSAA